jgi:hypothetical protein
MKKTTFFLFSIATVIFLSCEEIIIESDPPEEITLKLEFANNQSVFELKNGESIVEYYLTNISEKQVLIPIIISENGEHHILKKNQHFHNSNWVTDLDLFADSIISIEPHESMRDWFLVDKIGKWRTIIPIVNQDSIISSEIFVLDEGNDMQYLEFKFLSADGVSNLMPPNISDPIGINASFVIENKSTKKTIDSIITKKCLVFLANDSLLGEISMYSYPEIKMFPSQKDTINFYKLTNESKLFDTPCGDSIYVKIQIEDKFENGKELLTNIFLYECSY